MEEVSNRSSLSEEKSQCEMYFVNTHYHQADGRYVVRLPFKVTTPIPIGETEHIIRRIFFSNETKLARNSYLTKEYQSFMREYEELNHIEKVSPVETNESQKVYFPYHPVIKETSQTTKVRVVFNASRTSSNDTLLNDYLMVGPKLQTDLFALILRWRSHKFVYVTDIAKMFQHPSDVDYQWIFWRDNPKTELRSYRLLTVTYSTAFVPYLANRVLKQLARDEGENYPLAARE